MKKLCALFMLLNLIYCCNGDPELTAKAGETLPVFSVLLADSVSHFSTKNVVDDKAMVLFYFGPYCSTSRAQMQGIIEHMDELKDIRFLILTGAPFVEMKSFYDHFQLASYSNVLVGIDKDGFFINYFKPEGVPYTVVYGRDRKLKEIFFGGVESHQIIGALRR